MIQQKVKAQMDELKKQGEKIQIELGKGLDVAKSEGQRILKELGVDTSSDKLDIKEIVLELREANPSVKEFLRNLSVATYDTRFRFNWNASMISAYAKQQAEKTYENDLKPKFDEMRDVLQHQLHELQVKTKDLKARIIA